MPPSPLLLAAVLACAAAALASESSVLAPGAAVEQLAGDCKFTEGPTCDAAGNVFFTDQPNDRILAGKRLFCEAGSDAPHLWRQPSCRGRRSGIQVRPPDDQLGTVIGGRCFGRLARTASAHVRCAPIVSARPVFGTYPIAGTSAGLIAPDRHPLP